MLGVIKINRKQLLIKCFLTFMIIINNIGRVDRNSSDISTSKQPEYVCVHGKRLVCPDLLTRWRGAGRLLRN